MRFRCQGREIGHALLNGDEALAASRLAEWREVFADRFYLEVQRTNRVNDEEHLHAAVALAERSGAPLVATNDVRFLKQEDFEAHETRVCIGEGRTLDDPRRPRTYSDQQYLKTPEEMAELFADLPEALENTVEIAKRCNIEVQLGTYFLPNFPVPEGMTIDDYLRQVSFEGLEERLEVLLPKDTPDYEAKKQVYIDRLEFELGTIIQMGFPGYFLIVMDFISGPRTTAYRSVRAVVRCRLAGGLRAEDHRPRSAGLRPAVRALPQPRAYFHARLRRRLLHGRPRPGHRLRGRSVRAQCGEPDHHLRHHGGQGGGA